MVVAIDNNILQRIPLFRGLNETEFHQITEVLKERRFKSGDVIIRQGGESRDL
jgi:hypothetical protein